MKTLFTDYDFSCGCINTVWYGSYKVVIYKRYDSYHIKTYNKGQRVDWTVKDTHKEATKYFNDVVKNVRLT